MAAEGATADVVHVRLTASSYADADIRQNIAQA